MGPSDKAVEDVLYQKSVLGRAGDVKELKAAYLVRFLYAALPPFALSPLIPLPHPSPVPGVERLDLHYGCRSPH